MSLAFLDGGRLCGFTDIVDLLADHVQEPSALLEVFGRLYRDKVIGIGDRFRYSVELANGHCHQRLEVWAYFSSHGKPHPFKPRQLLLTLKSTLPEKEGLRQVPPFMMMNKPLRGYRGRPPVHTRFEGLVPERGASRPPGPPCPDCDLSWKCLDGCKRNTPDLITLCTSDTEPNG